MTNIFIKKTQKSLQNHIFWGMLGALSLGQEIGGDYTNIWRIIPVILGSIWIIMKCGMMRGKYTIPVWAITILVAKILLSK